MRKNWLTVLAAACFVAVAAASGQADDGSIAVYLDDAGTQCEGNLGGITNGSIWMNLGGATAGGITGVEFRVDNSDAASYDVSFTADAAATISLGNPFLTGCNVAWAACQTGTAGRVKIGTLLILEMAHTADVMLTVRQHYTPSSEIYRCPLAVLCDDPVYTQVCVGAADSDHWRAVINPSDGVSGICLPVAVEPASWSAVKALYH